MQQVLFTLGVVIGPAGDLRDLLQRGLVELGMDGEAVDVRVVPRRAANADCVDAHAAVGSRSARQQAGQGARCSRHR